MILLMSDSGVRCIESSLNFDCVHRAHRPTDTHLKYCVGSSFTNKTQWKSEQKQFEQKKKIADNLIEIDNCIKHIISL